MTKDYKYLAEYTEVDVIVNYQTINLMFNTQINNKLDQKKIIVFINQNNPSGENEILYYINNLKIMKGGYYQIELSELDGCFLYFYRAEMACYIPKQGYVRYEKNVITADKCSSMRSQQNTLMYNNPYTMECENSFIKIQNCLSVSYIDLNICSKCMENMIFINGKCECIQGMFLNQKTKSCQNCSKICLTCQDFESNCTFCKNGMLVPQCKCQENQYLDENYQCQNCNEQCEKCILNGNNCTKCSQDRIYEPVCNCDTQYFQPSLDVNKPCEKYNCLHQCIDCTYSVENCTYCRGNRENLPACTCPDNFYESKPPGENCIPCPPQTYLDQDKNQCFPCHESCQECRGPKMTDCKQCQQFLQFTAQNECKCETEDNPLKDSNNKLSCFDYFDLEFEIDFMKFYYLINIRFDYELEDNIDSQVIQNNIIFELYDIQHDQYELEFHKYDKQTKKLSMKLNIKASFQASSGYMIFKNNRPFINRKKKGILNPKYTKEPLQFEIGPYLFILDEQTKEVVTSVNDATDIIEQGNKNILSFVRNIQVLFYLINSLQPTAMFLLVKVNLPLNFYSFLQFFGTVVYKRVPDYQVTLKEYDFYLFQYHVTKQNYVGPGNQLHIQFAFSDSFIVNIPIIILKYIILGIFIFIVNILKQIKFYPENLPSLYHKRKKFKSTLYEVEKFMFNRLHQENEVNLLMFVLCLCIQFKNWDNNIWLSRWSFYIGVLFFIAITFVYTQYFLTINGNDKEKRKLFSNEFDERLKKKSSRFISLNRNYNFIAIMKKLTLVLSVYFLVDFPLQVCIIGVILNLGSSILTVVLLPHKRLYHSIVKIIGDIIQTVTWSLMIYFVRFQQNHKNPQIEQDEVDKLNFYGNIASIFIFIFNIIYLAQFIFDTIIFKLWSLCKTDKYYLVYKKVIKKSLPNDSSSQTSSPSHKCLLDQDKILCKKQKTLNLQHVQLQ